MADQTVLCDLAFHPCAGVVHSSMVLEHWDLKRQDHSLILKTLHWLLVRYHIIIFNICNQHIYIDCNCSCIEAWRQPSGSHLLFVPELKQTLRLGISGLLRQLFRSYYLSARNMLTFHHHLKTCHLKLAYPPWLLSVLILLLTTLKLFTDWRLLKLLVWDFGAMDVSYCIIYLCSFGLSPLPHFNQVRKNACNLLRIINGVVSPVHFNQHGDTSGAAWHQGQCHLLLW